MNADNGPLTPDYRVAALIAEHRAALDEAERLTSFVSVVTMIGHYRSRINWFERNGQATALGMLGENGLAPAIRSVLRSARFHAADCPALVLDRAA